MVPFGAAYIERKLQKNTKIITYINKNIRKHVRINRPLRSAWEGWTYYTMFAIRVNMKMHCILLLLLSTIVASFSSLNDRPVIGVLSTPDDSKSTFYIAASYVKWLESAGARAIAIPFYASDDLIESIFYQVNGILFPGGADYKDMPDSARKIWKLAKTANDSGNHFPLWGTCLGFEFMVMLAASEDPIQQCSDR